MFTILPSWMGAGAFPATNDRATAAISEYRNLISRLGGISSEVERASIVSWVGDRDIPGSPAERFAVVTSDIEGGQPDPVLQAKRVTDLESVLLEFRSKIESAEAKYGASVEAGQAPVTGQEIGHRVAMGAIAFIGFFVIPFAMD
jgi:hypothetical protein